MPLDFDILCQFGTDNNAIRRLFTAAPDTDLGKKRKKWEELIEARLHEGVMFNLRNHRLYAAIDLAWDSMPLTKEIVPLMQYAQGKIDIKKLKPQLKNLSRETLEKFVEFDESGKDIKAVNFSKFTEVWVNLIRSYVSRRVATLSAKYTKLYPFLKYEVNSTSFVAKLRGDVISQLVESMSMNYGYRHELVQAIRDMLLYGHAVEFPACAWDVQKQLRKKERSEGYDTSGDRKFEVESYIVKEGQPFARPHITRTFFDNSAPLAQINTDTGPQYIGYWNITRFREVDGNPAYFNRGEVGYSSSWHAQLLAHMPYFELYYADAPINLPQLAEGFLEASAQNDRENNVGRYSSDNKDTSIVLAEYREKVIPKEVGLGDYPFPVWVRLVVAGGRTVVYGEILPSTPAVYYGYNEDDSRQVNISFGHEIIPWQDQMSNMLTQLLFTQRSGLIKILCANIDLIPPEVLKEFRAILKGDRYTTGPMLIEFQGDQLAQNDMNIQDVIKVNETTMMQDVSVFFESVLKLMSIAERVLNISPQELGQSANHQISATETTEMARTTTTMLEYMGLGVDEGLAAKKRLIFEAYMALGQDRVFVPVVNRYTPETIKAAGFEFVDEDKGESAPENYSGDGKKITILGSKQALNYAYNFTVRDGGERPINAKGAEVAVQLLAQLGQIPGLLQDLGKDRLYLFINHIVRTSGVGVDLSFDVQDGEPEKLPTGDPAQDHKDAIQDMIRQIVGAVEQQKTRIEQLEAMARGMPGVAQQGAAPAAPAAAMPAAAMPAAA